MPNKETDYDKLARQVAAGFKEAREDLVDFRKEVATKLELHDAIEASEERILHAIAKVQQSVEWNKQEVHDLEQRWNSRFRSLEDRIGRLEKKR